MLEWVELSGWPPCLTALIRFADFYSASANHLSYGFPWLTERLFLILNYFVDLTFGNEQLYTHFISASIDPTIWQIKYELIGWCCATAVLGTNCHNAKPNLFDSFRVGYSEWNCEHLLWQRRPEASVPRSVCERRTTRKIVATCDRCGKYPDRTIHLLKTLWIIHKHRARNISWTWPCPSKWYRIGLGSAHITIYYQQR